MVRRWSLDCGRWADVACPDLVMSDVDGTLTDGGYGVSPHVAALLRDVVDAGVRVALITGRSLQSLTKIAALVERPLILGSCNGGYVIDQVTGQVIHRARYDTALVEKIAQALEGEDAGIMYYTPQAVYAPADFTMRGLVESSEKIRVHFGMPPQFADVCKVTVAMNEELCEAIAARLQPQFPQLVRSVPWILEVTQSSASKEAATRALLDDLGLDPSRVIGCGDGENDANWLKMTGTVVAPEDATPGVRAIADVLVPPCEDEGVARFLAAHCR